jgi:ABC-type antimicrobial peptide transport system permease subunit
MKWIDILAAAFNNLRRRKLRSALTMLGVVIGTAAIVVTISLGYGAEKTQLAALEANTNLRLIQVYPNYGYSDSSASTTGNRITTINDSVLRRIRAIEGVDALTPIVNLYAGVNFSLKVGKRVNQATMLMGVLPRDFAKMVKLKSGRFFSSTTGTMEFIMSEVPMMDFQDPKAPDESVDVYDLWQNGKPLPLPRVNWLTEPFTMTMSWEESREDSADVDAEPVVKTKDYKARMVGILPADFNDMTYGYSAVVNLHWLKKMFKENKQLFKGMGVDSLDKYDVVNVLATDVDSVQGVVKELVTMGVQCYSTMDAINTIRQQIQTMQAFLGFIGAISLLVAALSIANTMMMSIYERTREIGVMKVLGCKLSNIRVMFLSEAAYIGVIGGALGLLASYLLSYALNNVDALRQVASSIMQSGYWYESEDATVSIIPPALALGTWLFVVFVSVGSGFYPAQRATRLSSLAAIRTAD